MGKRKNQPRLIPEQNKKICGTICLCQLTIVLSCVSFVYLIVVVYLPSYKAFQSGYDPDPVMCQTVNTSLNSNCAWASCGEWCLTKASGFCPQIHASSRRNGTEVTLQNCSKFLMTSCPMVNVLAMKKYNCNNGTECDGLTGMFNCSLGHCVNWSDRFLCNYKADGATIDAEKNNQNLNGFFECKNAICTKIKKPFHCDRYCPNITTVSRNIFIMQEDSLFTADCEFGFAHNQANGNLKGTILKEPEKIWEENDGTMLTSCMEVTYENGTIRASDCINGTLLRPDEFPEPKTNFTEFWKVYRNSSNYISADHRFLPKQSVLTIFNTSRLYINLDGCVNTLRGECKEFIGLTANDGDNDTAQSRYQCFFNPDNNFAVLGRFDLDKTWREFVIAITIPLSMFAVSCTALTIVMFSVKVGDDTRMRCKYCTDENSDLEAPPKPLAAGPTIKKKKEKKPDEKKCKKEDHKSMLDNEINGEAAGHTILPNDDEYNEGPPNGQVENFDGGMVSSDSLQKSLNPSKSLSPCTEVTERTITLSVTTNSDTIKDPDEQDTPPLVVL